MKLFIKLILLLVVLAMAGPFFLLGPDGRPLMSLQDFSLPTFSFALPDMSSLKPDGKTVSNLGNTAKPLIEWSQEKIESPEKLTRDQLALLDIKAQDNIYYRWQDQNGVWQFSALPNKNTLNFVVKTDPNANLLEGMSEEAINVALGRISPNTNTIAANNPMANGEGLDSKIPIPTTIPIAEVPKLIDQAKDVQRIMEERLSSMDKMTGQ